MSETVQTAIPKLTSEPAIQALMAGRADVLLTPRTERAALTFAIPAGTEGVWLLSRSFVPNAAIGTVDRRRLGIAVQRIAVDGRTLRLDDGALTDGWHPVEPGYRWSNGCAWFPLPPGAARLEITVHPGCPGFYPVPEADGEAARTPLGEYRAAIQETLARAANHEAARHLLALPTAVPAGEALAGTSLPIDRLRGTIEVVTPDGARHTVTRSGVADHKLAPGWSVEGVFAGASDFYVLALVREGGDRAAWYLDEAFRYVGNSPSALQEAYRASLRTAVLDYVDAVWRGLVCAPTAAFEPSGFMLSGMDPGLRATLIREQPTAHSAKPVEIVVDALDALLTADEGAGEPRQGVLDSRQIRHIFARDCFELLTGAIRDRRLVLASPFDGSPLEAQGGLLLNTFTIAYRFADAAAGHAFYAVMSLWKCDLVALYFPGLRIAVFRDEWSLGRMKETLGADLQTALLAHCSEHAPALGGYFAMPDKQFVAMIYQSHLGHHLWNELAGLDALERALPPEALPTVYVLRAAETEMFGPVDVLFPRLRGRIDRTLDGSDALARHAYAHALCPLRCTTDFVPRAMASRISAHNEASPALDPDRARHAALAAGGWSVVLLGLRVENRTLVDQEAFFADVIGTCLAELGRVAFVIDGHNSRDGLSFRSHGEQSGTAASVAEEQRIAGLLAYRFRDNAAVQIIDTIGASLAASIFWCNRAAFFVTPWGAGLAKYRWMCNRPGIVVAGRRFLQHAGQSNIHLYDWPRYMGAPTRMLINAPEAAEDEPDQSLLVALPDPNRVNFSVSREAVALMVQHLARMGRQKEGRTAA